MIRATLCCISDKRRSRLYKQARFAPHFIDTRNWRSRPTFSEFLLARTKENVDDMTVPAAWRAIAVVVLAAASVRSLANLDDFCRVAGEGYHCASCLQPVQCASDSSVVNSLICQNSVCEEDLTSASCVAMEDASKCQCNSDQCDSYNSANVDLCNNNGIYDVLNCDVVTCPAVECPCTGITNLPGWDFSCPDCTKAFYCREDGSFVPFECEANAYFDDNGECQPAPPQPCASGCTTGLCPDNQNCTNFYYCDAGTPIQLTSCPAGQYFNPNANSTQVCQADPDVCARLTYCNFNGSSAEDTTTPTTATHTTTTLTTATHTTTTPTTPTPTTQTPTTPTPTTTTSATTAGPPPCSAATAGNTAAGPCSSSYWSCRNTGGGVYQPVPMECPDGRVFSTDPLYPYCVLPENEETCS